MPKSRPKPSTSSPASVDSNFEVPQPKSSCPIVFRTSKGELDENPATVATYNVEMTFERKHEDNWKFELLHGKALKGNYLIVRPSFDKDGNIYRDALHIQGEKWDQEKKYTVTSDGLTIHRVVFWKLTSQVGTFRLMATSGEEMVVSEPFSVGSRRPGTATNPGSSDTEENVVEEEEDNNREILTLTEEDNVTESPKKKKRSRSGKGSRKRPHSATANSPETATNMEQTPSDDAISQTISPMISQVIRQVAEDVQEAEQQQEISMPPVNWNESSSASGVH